MATARGQSLSSETFEITFTIIEDDVPAGLIESHTVYEEIVGSRRFSRIIPLAMALGGHTMPQDDALSRQYAEMALALQQSPYSAVAYCERAMWYSSLDYPDLAVMDLYKALLLCDDIVDGGEYQDSALSAMREDISWPNFHSRLYDLPTCLDIDDSTILRLLESLETVSGGTVDEETVDEARSAFCDRVRSVIIPTKLAHHLADIGCLVSAERFVQVAIKTDGEYEPAQLERRRISKLISERSGTVDQESSLLKARNSALLDRGVVRREIYPWNYHERDRLSEASMNHLNEKLRLISQKIEVRMTELPVLRPAGPDQAEDASVPRTIKQLGLFATEDIQPGESVLRERSMLAANARLLEPLCDACSSRLPRLGEGEIFNCDSCDDIAFCSETCRDLAQDLYHRGICGVEVEDVGKTVDASQAADALYTQLLFRSMSMSITQDVHPLDLDEVKYIWGDFDDLPTSSLASDGDREPRASKPCNLPYSFEAQVMQPLHLLELLDINIFEAPHDLAETWVYNTLYAKFRGTASSRISPRDGRPEVAAVHPLWCLANHSCSPNVQWEWAADIEFVARPERVAWKRETANGGSTEEQPARIGGITKGEEILNHYVDIDLPVDERRAWGTGALGGPCLCDRCKWESEARGS